MWPGEGARPMNDAGPGARLRDLLGGGSLRRMGLVGWLGWLGMWCGIVAMAGLFVGVTWAALDGGAARRAEETAKRELVERLCGEVPVPSQRLRGGILR